MVASVLTVTPLALALLSGQVFADTYYQGDGTAYTLGSTSSGNCNMMSALGFASTNYAAINAAQWNDMKNCGRCAEVSCIDASCAHQSTTQVVQILDQCPECSEGDLDLSPTVFETITGSTPSRLKIKWRFVDCPVSGNVQYCLKGGSNNFWTAVQPANTVNGVASMTINSQSTTMVPSAYYYLLNGNSQAQVDLSALTISLTSTSGEVLTDTVSLTAGSCISGSYQFGSSGNTASQTATPTTTTTAPATTAPATTAPATTAPSTTAPTTTTPTPTTTAPATTAPTTTSPAPTTASPTSTPSPTPTSTPVPSAATDKPTQSSYQQTGSSNSTSSASQSEADSGSDNTSTTPSPSPTAKPTSTPTPATVKPTPTTQSIGPSTSALTFTSSPSTTTTSSSSSTPAPEQETQTANTKSLDGSSTSSALIALAVVGVVGVVALVVIVAVAKKKKIENKEPMETPMDFCAVVSAGNHLDGRTPRPNHDVAIL